MAALPIKQPGSVPAQLRGKPLGAQGISSGNIPTLAQLGLQPLSNIPGAPKCKGGGCPALSQSRHWMDEMKEGLGLWSYSWA